MAQSARVLGLIGGNEAEPLLIGLLASPPPGVARCGGFGARAGRNRQRPHRVCSLLWATRPGRYGLGRSRPLAALADETVGPAVVTLLSDREWWVRQNAAETLGEIPGGVAHLVAALDSPTGSQPTRPSTSSRKCKSSRPVDCRCWSANTLEARDRSPELDQLRGARHEVGDQRDLDRRPHLFRFDAALHAGPGGPVHSALCTDSECSSGSDASQDMLGSDLSPPVSIVVPAYNESVGIVESIRSMAMVTYPRVRDRRRE